GAWRSLANRALWSSATIVALFGVVVLSIAIARVAQVPRARALLESYASAAVAPAATSHAAPDGGVRLSLALFEPAVSRERVQQAMLVLDVTAACGSPDIPIHVRYEREGALLSDFSRDVLVHVAAPSRSMRVFVPAYSVETAGGNVSRFASVDVPAASVPCVRLSRAPSLERSALLLDATLADDWQTQPMYQRLYIGPLLPERVWVR